MLVTKIDNVREKRQTRCENEDFREELEYLADENDTLNRIAMREDRVVVDCKKDTLVKTKNGRLVMVGDVIKSLQTCAKNPGYAECDCNGVYACMNRAAELAGLAADVLETLMED